MIDTSDNLINNIIKQIIKMSIDKLILLLLLYWFVSVDWALLFFNQNVFRPFNHSNCPFIAKLQWSKIVKAWPKSEQWKHSVLGIREKRFL